MALDGKSITSVDYGALGTSMHQVAWSHLTLGTVLLDHILTFKPLYTPKPHEILKTHRIIIIFIYFMGNHLRVHLGLGNMAKPAGFAVSHQI